MVHYGEVMRNSIEPSSIMKNKLENISLEKRVLNLIRCLITPGMIAAINVLENCDKLSEINVKRSTFFKKKVNLFIKIQV